jgi:hypothetical protein
MEKKSKKERFIAFMDRNAEWIVPVTATLAVSGLYIIAVVVTNKQHNQAVTEYNAWVDQEYAWLNEQDASGKAVYALADGSYLTVPKEELPNTEWIRR